MELATPEPIGIDRRPRGAMEAQSKSRRWMWGCGGCAGLVSLALAAAVVLTNTDRGRIATGDLWCHAGEDGHDCTTVAMIHEERGELAQAESYYRHACETLSYESGCVGMAELAREYRARGEFAEASRLAADACASRVAHACDYLSRWRAEDGR
jgi:hypothetical protein